MTSGILRDCGLFVVGAPPHPRPLSRDGSREKMRRLIESALTTMRRCQVVG